MVQRSVKVMEKESLRHSFLLLKCSPGMKKTTSRMYCSFNVVARSDGAGKLRETLQEAKPKTKVEEKNSRLFKSQEFHTCINELLAPTITVDCERTANR
ncbi:Hypothetical predicted protein [Octopus vulgaris]|uniref:Uncharacterized protein n=1 Tax=Octopus vulgaris TaxID=6645 RepID=A0AA36FH69_OCTVU|nr:Hypothetical predicted protein [Octopus vulgaris]